MIFWVHKKSANVQSLSNNYIFGNDMIFWISTIDKGIIAKAKKWRGILNHPFFSFLKTLFLNFFFFFAKTRYVEFPPKFFEKKHCTKATCYGVVTTWFMSMFHSEMFSQGSPFCDWSFSLTSHLILLLERSREKFTGFNAVTQHNSTIHSVLKTKKSSIWGSHRTCFCQMARMSQFGELPDKNGTLSPKFFEKKPKIANIWPKMFLSGNPAIW